MNFELLLTSVLKKGPLFSKDWNIPYEMESGIYSNAPKIW